MQNLDADALHQSAQKAAELLKMISHPHRLLLLCKLTERPCNVTELIEKVGITQTAMSNHLSLLREANIVRFTRERRTLVYQICSPETQQILDTIYQIYCEDSQ